MKILVSGGGTGGHIYPAISIMETFDKKDEFLYIGTKNSMEEKLISKLNIPFKSISVEGFNRKSKLKNILVIIKLIIGMIQSLFIVLKFKPDIVIGTGGYVSGPILFISSLLGKKTFVHEQNAYPGITNKILSKYVSKVFVSYKESINKFKTKNVFYTGNPVRKDFKNKTDKTINKNDSVLKVLSFGGSGGAEKINNLIFELILHFNGLKEYEITHVTGKKYYNEFLNKLKNSNIDLEDNIKIFDYLNNMPEHMVNADLVISRAGAISISEMKYTKTPSILIPSPNVTDNHQEYNGREMENEGFSKMILEKDINVKKIIDFIKSKEEIDKIKKAFDNYKIVDVSQIINEEIIKEVRK